MRGGEHAFCERVLRSLPDWFGIEESLVQYVRDTQTLPTWIAVHGEHDIGFVTLREHNPRAAEIHCIAVLPEAHRHGVGRAMVRHVEHHLRARGFRFLQVKTLGPSRTCAHYELTRRFYLAVGFTPLEEFPTLWPGNPCLLLVKSLA
jgi:ribosomal protein S18 acetylase RimI-like enzyme